MGKEKYNKLSVDELVDLVEKQDKELKSKKYGLVWDAEREPEQVVLECENKLPILQRMTSKEVKTDDSDDNILIEGDNYHALTVLNYTHAGKIDFIYIDPPYNTGAKDWKYNNNFVGDDDGFRHSKWLNFMEKRLNASKPLLKDDGIICVTIDDYELPTLWLLMNKIFGEENHLGTVVIRNNPKGRMTQRKFSLIHEYGIFFGKSNQSKIKRIPIDPSEKTHNYQDDGDGDWYLKVNLRKQGIDSNAVNKKGKLSERYYPIYYDPKTGRVSTLTKLPLEILPIDPTGQKRIWRRSKDVIDKMFEDGEIIVSNRKNGHQLYFKFRGGLEGRLPQSIWVDPKYSASEHGTQTLDRILGSRELFQFPKSPHAVIESILASTNKKDATILDYFAGSGTTGQAVLELNKTDDGERRFILCTNNENKICEEVTYPRVKNVIKGYKYNGASVDGLGGNLQYFKTSLIKKTNNRDQVRHDLTQKCTEMLCVKENIYNLETETEDYKIFSSNKRDKFLCIYYNFVNNNFGKFIKNLENIDGEKSIYIFSINDSVDESLLKGVSDYKVEAIPQKILDVYRQLVRLNIKGLKNGK